MTSVPQIALTSPASCCSYVVVIKSYFTSLLVALADSCMFMCCVVVTMVTLHVSLL